MLYPWTTRIIPSALRPVYILLELKFEAWVLLGFYFCLKAEKRLQLGDMDCNSWWIWALFFVVQLYLAFHTVVFFKKGHSLVLKWEPLGADYAVIWKEFLELLILTETCTYFPSFSSPFQRVILTLGESLSWWRVKTPTLKAYSVKILYLHCLLTPQSAALWILGHLWDFPKICSSLPELLSSLRVALDLKSNCFWVSLVPWSPSLTYCFARLYFFLCLNVVVV